VLHTDEGFPCTLGDRVSVGHMCMLHGCVVGDETLIGIGAVVLTGAKIGKNCIIGANSLVGEHKEIPDNSLVFGSPGRVVRQTEARHIELIRETAKHYAERWRRYVEELSVDEG
jgi:carbonic anhydrase/acetyltransferase-like protein (isoleucine patch superfamily)